jgi:hypothetical protein
MAAYDGNGSYGAIQSEITNGPVFVLTVARSGSTLLRFILDAHPDLACPPELGVGATCAGLLRVWSVTEGTLDAGVLPRLGAEHLTDRAVSGIRAAVEAAFVPYLAGRGAARWCDKSLDTLPWAGLVARIWPDARFICLYRHAMDVIGSSLEACPWGLDGFGFERYTVQYPGNNVAAAGASWVAGVSTMIEFEKAHLGRTLRIRYEDLVIDPESVAAEIFDFAGVAPEPGISQSCFTAAHEANGPGDPKIWFTTGVSVRSVGRGSDVPAGKLPPPLRTAMNEALSDLGYVQVGEDWNAVQRRVTMRGVSAGTSREARQSTVAPASSQAGPDADLEAVTALVDIRDKAVDVALLGAIASCWPGLSGLVLGIDLTGSAGGLAQFRWVVDGPNMHADAVAEGAAESSSDDTAADRGEDQREVVLTADGSLWQAVLEGRANLWTELRAGRLVARGVADGGGSHELHAIGVLLGLAQLPALACHQASPRRSAGAGEKKEVKQ